MFVLESMCMNVIIFGGFMKRVRFICVLLTVCLLTCTLAFAKNFEKVRTYDARFTDVPANSWFAKNVAAVFEAELMEGVSETQFDTESEMSVSQAITIAARLHSIYNDKEIPEVSGGRWFQKYVDYCLDNKIMAKDQFDSYSRSVLSYEMVELFAAALPKEFYPAINKVTEIHDVPSSLDFADDVLLFYNAGILNGNDSKGTFLPMSAITRKRAAVILSRTALADQRITFSLDKAKASYSVDEVLYLVSMQTVPETLDTMVLVSHENIGITAAEYRYYSYISGGDNTKTEGELKNAVAAEKYIRGMNLSVSKEDYEAILVSYYAPRTSNYGNTSYFDTLDDLRLTDSAFAKLITLNKLSFLALSKECADISPDEVYAYAKNNDFICAKNLLISSENEDGYRKALEIYLSLSDGKDFDELLEEFGEDAGMDERKNGYIFTRGWMDATFEKTAYELKDGEISDIIETDEGYHIIKRVAFDKNILASSPDYATVAGQAGAEKYTSGINALKSSITLSYIDNFDGLSALLK